MDNFYKVELTGNKVYYFRELTLNEYKNLQKACVDENHDVFQKFVDKMLSELLIDDDVSEFNIVDKLLACLYVRYYSVNDTKTMITHFKNKEAKMPIDIYGLIEKVKESIKEIDQVTTISINNFMAEKVEVDVFDFNNPIRAFIVKGKRIEYTDDMDSLIPASIFIDINEVINNLMSKFNNVKLFEITTKDGTKVQLDLDNNMRHLYNVMKIMLKDDLPSLYKNLYDLKTKININFNEFDYITYSEFEIYVSQFNEEQNQIEQDMNQNQGNKMIP